MRTIIGLPVMVMRVNWGNPCEVLRAECRKCKLLLLLGLLLLPPEQLIWPFQQPFKWKISLCDLPHWKGIPGYWWSEQSVCRVADTKVKYVCFITPFLPHNYYFGEFVLLDTIRKPQGLPSRITGGWEAMCLWNTAPPFNLQPSVSQDGLQCLGLW